MLLFVLNSIAVKKLTDYMYVYSGNIINNIITGNN